MTCDLTIAALAAHVTIVALVVLGLWTGHLRFSSALPLDPAQCMVSLAGHDATAAEFAAIYRIGDAHDAAAMAAVVDETVPPANDGKGKRR